MDLSKNNPPKVTPTPVTGFSGTAPFPGGTERRRTQQTISVTMPNSGRMVEDFYENLIHELEEGFVTTRTVRKAVADCSCPVEDVMQLRECSTCLAVVCLSHSGTCDGGCGRVYCSSCARLSEERLLCRKCAKREGGKQLRAAFWGLLWRKV